MSNDAREHASRLIRVIRDRAFAELARERGELVPMALTMDDNGRIGSIAVYTGDSFGRPATMLADLIATVKQQAALHALASAAIAHSEAVVVEAGTLPVDAVCVRYEHRRAPALRIYFPYQIRKKLRGPSEITRLKPITREGTRAVLP